MKPEIPTSVIFSVKISITQQTVDEALALVRLAGLCWALLMLVFINDAEGLVCFTFKQTKLNNST